MKNKLWLAIALLLATFLNLHAQTAQQSYTLKDCIEYSLKNNPTNIIFSNDVLSANQKKVEALSGYLPQINGNVNWDDNLKRQTTVLPGAAFGQPEDVKLQFGNQYITTAVAQLDQTIYDQTLISGLAGIKPNQASAELKKAKNDDDLIYNTAIAYYRIVTIKEQAKLLEQNFKKFKELENLQKLLLDKGVIKKTDYDRVRVGLNNITSQTMLVQSNLEVATNSLKNAMGMPLDQPISIIDSVSILPSQMLPTQNMYDVKNTWDYQILTKNILLQEVQLKRTRAGYFPTLGFYARYGAQAFGNNFSESFNDWYDYGGVGLKLQVPIFDGLRKSSLVKQATLTLSNARQSLILTENGLKLQYQNANSQLLSSYTNLQSNKENLDLAKEVFDNTTFQYQKGVAGLSDVLNADYSLKEAQTNYLTSFINYLVAKTDIEKAKGTLKQYITQF